MPYNLRKRKAPEPEKEKKQKVTKKVERKVEQKVEKKAEQKAEQKEELKEEQKEERKEEHKGERKEKRKEDQKGDQKEPTGGKVLLFGQDSCGEFGLKRTGFIKKNPCGYLTSETFKQVACGPMHTLSLTVSGIVYSHGCNDEGALGRVTDGDDELESTPTVVELKDKVTKISSGDSHGLALTEKQDVFAWGNFRDDHGSIGLTPECDGKASYKPFQLLPGTKFKDIASGSNHALLLDTKGVVYSFGVGFQGQLGRLGPEELAKEGDAITAENRKLFLSPQIVDLKNVDPQRPFVCDAIYAGNFSSFATNTDKKKNRLAGWGLNNYHQLGHKGQKGQTLQFYPKRSTFTCSTSMINVACGQHHTVFLTKTGRVYAAGRNQYGLLGNGEQTNDKDSICPATRVEKGFDEPITTISAGSRACFAVDTAGKIFSWGQAGYGQLTDPAEGPDYLVPTKMKSLVEKEVISVSAGESFTAVIVK